MLEILGLIGSFASIVALIFYLRDNSNNNRKRAKMDLIICLVLVSLTAAIFFAQKNTTTNESKIEQELRRSQNPLPNDLYVLNRMKLDSSFPLLRRIIELKDSLELDRISIAKLFTNSRNTTTNPELLNLIKTFKACLSNISIHIWIINNPEKSIQLEAHNIYANAILDFVTEDTLLVINRNLKASVLFKTHNFNSTIDLEGSEFGYEISYSKGRRTVVDNVECSSDLPAFNLEAITIHDTKTHFCKSFNIRVNNKPKFGVFRGSLINNMRSNTKDN